MAYPPPKVNRPIRAKVQKSSNNMPMDLLGPAAFTALVAVVACAVVAGTFALDPAAITFLVAEPMATLTVAAAIPFMMVVPASMAFAMMLVVTAAGVGIVYQTPLRESLRRLVR